jgi:hypothetical protein
MTKKVYMQPVMAVLEADTEQQILVSSVQTSGLGDDNLGYNDGGGNQSEAWVRGNGRVNWDDDWSN